MGIRSSNLNLILTTIMSSYGINFVKISLLVWLPVLLTFRISCIHRILKRVMTSFRIRCIGQSDCCQKRCLTQALNWCLTLETIVSCRIWQILNPSKCHITNSCMVLMEESFLTGKKIRLLQFCDSGMMSMMKVVQNHLIELVFYLDTDFHRTACMELIFGLPRKMTKWHGMRFNSVSIIPCHPLPYSYA